MSYLKKMAQSQIRMRNIQILATDMDKLINNLSPPIMNRVFKLNSYSGYNLRQTSQFFKSLVKSVYHGTTRQRVFPALPQNMGYTN